MNLAMMLLFEFFDNSYNQVPLPAMRYTGTMIKLPKKLWLTLATVALFASAICAYVLLRPVPLQAPPIKQTKLPNTQVVKTAQNELRFAAMGDMLAHDTINQQAKQPIGYDYKPYFKLIKPLYDDADVVFCNPETLAAGQAYGISGYPAFNAPTEFARDLADKNGAGCNLINLATNHIGDKTQAAIDTTLDVWDQQKPLAISGANRSPDEQNTVHYFTKNGIKVAFLAFADYSNNKSVTSYGLNNYHADALLSELMTTAHSNADAVVVSMHWGTEDSNEINLDQQTTAQTLANLGADVIIGTGPHVVQKATWLTGQNGRKTLVWYSIGNMLSSQLKINELTGGVAGFTVKKLSTRIVVEQPTFKATFMSYDWSPTDKAAENLLARHNLTLQPLADAIGRPEAMFGNQYNVTERAQYLKNTLTSEASVAIEP